MIAAGGQWLPSWPHFNEFRLVTIQESSYNSTPDRSGGAFMCPGDLSCKSLWGLPWGSVWLTHALSSKALSFKGLGATRNIAMYDCMGGSAALRTMMRRYSAYPRLGQGSFSLALERRANLMKREFLFVGICLNRPT